MSDIGESVGDGLREFAEQNPHAIQHLRKLAKDWGPLDGPAAALWRAARRQYLATVSETAAVPDAAARPERRSPGHVGTSPGTPGMTAPDRPNK